MNFEKLTNANEAWDAEGDVKEFAEKMAASNKLTKKAAAFYRGLIPKSLHQPEKYYQHEKSNDAFGREADHCLQIMKEAKEKFTSAEYSKIKKYLFAKFLPDNEAIGGLTEEVSEYGMLDQQREYAFLQSGGANVIKEEISNVLFTHKNGTKHSNAMAFLAIFNKEKRLGVALNDFLPNDYAFTPASLDVCSSKVVEDKIVYTPIQTNLKHYQGTKGADDLFYETHASTDNALVASMEKKVTYGDLTKPGGVLALLHEVSHAWQNVYYNDFGKQKFEDFYEPVMMNLRLLKKSKEQFDNKEYGENSENSKDIYYNRIVPILKEELATQGVLIDIENVFYNGQELKKDEILLKDTLLDFGGFIVKTEKINKLIADYTRQERDAWAHGLKVLRFLKSNGFDLEPELKTSDDIKNHIHPCLANYQDNIDAIIDSAAQQKRFQK